LGLTFASGGNWANRIANIVNAYFKQVNVLRKLKFTLSKQTLYLHKANIKYACEVWDGCFEREVAKLEKVQLESARIVPGLTKLIFASSDSLYYETGWQPLSCRRKYRNLATFIKCIINYVLNKLGFILGIIALLVSKQEAPRLKNECFCFSFVYGL